MPIFFVTSLNCTYIYIYLKYTGEHDKSKCIIQKNEKQVTLPSPNKQTKNEYLYRKKCYLTKNSYSTQKKIL